MRRHALPGEAWDRRLVSFAAAEQVAGCGRQRDRRPVAAADVDLAGVVDGQAALAGERAVEIAVAAELLGVGDQHLEARTVVGVLQDVLRAHPGSTEVHLNLVINASRNTVLKLDDALRVAPTPSLMGDLKALLGPGCLG